MPRLQPYQGFNPLDHSVKNPHPSLTMSPIRRYLRITQHSVLECRIYLDNPADAHRWLLHPRSPALPRVIEAVRPLVLPKLREENARAKSGKGGGKRKGWKDVVVEGAFGSDVRWMSGVVRDVSGTDK